MIFTLICLCFTFRSCAETQTCGLEDGEAVEYFDLETEDKNAKGGWTLFGWFKRALKIAIPLQFFILMMLFFAWNGEPGSHHLYYSQNCESASRFSFLYPQLKYLNGPPPI